MTRSNAVLNANGPAQPTRRAMPPTVSAGSAGWLRTVPLTEFRAGLAAEGMPEDVLDLFSHLFTEVLDGRNSAPTDGVRRVLGRAAGELADHVRASAAAGCWG